MSTGGTANLWVGGAFRLLLAVGCIGALLFLSAGTTSWFRGWLFLGLLGATLLVNLALMITRTPTLLRERWKRRTDTKPFDKVFGLLYFVGTVSMLVIAGLDSVRLGWTSMAEPALYLGLLLHALGMIPVLGTLLVNPHLETTVRVQTDRDHRVISAGPYRYVRHPMYVGLILLYLSWPLVLGSWAALGVGLLVGLLLVVRTGFEDRTLRAELEGYAQYCERTRFRLLPGIW